MRVIIAARLSQLQKDGRPGIGIETQDERSREWAERENHHVVTVVADTVTGTKAPFDRKNLKEWVTDASKMAQYDGIVAYRNDRLSRGAWNDETRIRQWAEENHKVLLIVDGPQWPPRHDGDFWAWTSLAKSARDEWESARERTMRALAALQEKGKNISRPPFGYQSAGEKYDHHLIPTETGRVVVPEIFRWCINGDSLATIAERLDYLHVPTVPGKGWWPKSVGTLIRNTTYLGRQRDSAGKVIHKCEPLVSADVFRRANESLATRPKRGPLVEENRALLSGSLFCALCEFQADIVSLKLSSPMYRISPTDGREPFYRCSGRGPARRGCGNNTSVVEADALVSEFMAQFTSPVLEAKIVPGDSSQAELDDIELQLKELASQGLSEEIEDAERARLRAERRRLRELPASPDQVTWTDTGFTFADEWTGLETQQERGHFLRQRDIRVFAVSSRRGGLVQRTWARAMAPRAAVVLDGESVSLAVTWRYRTHS